MEEKNLYCSDKIKKERDKKEREIGNIFFLGFVLFIVELVIRYIKRKFRGNIRNYFKS